MVWLVGPDVILWIWQTESKHLQSSRSCCGVFLVQSGSVRTEQSLHAMQHVEGKDALTAAGAGCVWGTATMKLHLSAVQTLLPGWPFDFPRWRQLLKARYFVSTFVQAEDEGYISTHSPCCGGVILLGLTPHLKLFGTIMKHFEWLNCADVDDTNDL